MSNSLRYTFTINLTQGKQALVDEGDWYELRKCRWHARWERGISSYYAGRTVIVAGKQRAELMHRRIMGLSWGDPLQVDHRNHCTLDNRRQNLRIVTNRGNHENRRNRSPYGVGIARRKDLRSRPFQVSLWLNGRMVFVGRYATVEEAARARDDFLRKEEKA